MPRRFRVCHCCGFPLADDELAWLFTRTQLKIYLAVARAGRAGKSIEALVDRVYGDRPDGGPLYARNCMSVLIHQKINPKLAPHGLKITAGRGREGVPYRLVTLREAPATNRTRASGLAYARERI